MAACIVEELRLSHDTDCKANAGRFLHKVGIMQNVLRMSEDPNKDLWCWRLISMFDALVFNQTPPCESI